MEEEKIKICEYCHNVIDGLYEDNKDGTYICISCLIKLRDSEDLDNTL